MVELTKPSGPRLPFIGRLLFTNSISLIIGYCSDFLFVHGSVRAGFTFLGIYLSSVGGSLRQRFLGAPGPQPRGTGASSQASAGSIVGIGVSLPVTGFVGR